MTLSNRKLTYNVVIPAAGIGARFNSSIPKQYAVLDGQPIITKTIDFFRSSPIINNIVVVLHPQDQQWPTLGIDDPSIITVTGGATRAQSVLNGLGKLVSMVREEDYVLVHDACRPFIQEADLMRLIEAVKDDAVGGLLAIPATDTLKRVEEGRVVQTIARDTLWRAQTPQLFRFGLLQEALQKALAAGINITDEASAIEWQGLHPLIVQGSEANRKITYRDDL